MPAKSDYPAIIQGSDGYWHAHVTVGTKPSGQRDRRHISKSSREDAVAAVDELLAQKRDGAVVKPGRPVTVSQWLEVYLESVAPRRCDPSTVNDYRSKIKHWVLPVIGTTRLDRLSPDQLDQIYLKMQRARKADSTILKTHRILSRALEVAFRRKLVPRNVAKLIDSPTARAVEQTALALPEAIAVVEQAQQLRNSARWSVGLSLGLRQGEVLGLRWSYVNLDQAEMRVWWQLRRRPFEHGCRPPCSRRRGGNCPDRSLPLRSGEIVLEEGLILKEPKGKSRRTVPIPAELVLQLRTQLAAQNVERVLADGAWREHDLVFARPDGRPIDPSDDYAEWRSILDAAGVPRARLHDGRHTAGTILLALGVNIRVVQEILGHSDVRVTQGYVHVASELAREATQSIGSAMLKQRVAR